MVEGFDFAFDSARVAVCWAMFPTALSVRVPGRQKLQMTA